MATRRSSAAGVSADTILGIVRGVGEMRPGSMRSGETPQWKREA